MGQAFKTRVMEILKNYIAAGVKTYTNHPIVSEFSLFWILDSIPREKKIPRGYVSKEPIILIAMLFE